MAFCESGTCAVQHLGRDDRRKQYDHDLSKPHQIFQSLQDDILSIGDQYCENSAEMTQVEGWIHDLWDEIIHVAKVIPSTSFKQDRVVTLVMGARGLGPLSRNTTTEDGGSLQEVAVLPNGESLWDSLPYLAEDLQNYWTKESAFITAPERQSLAIFTAKLSSSDDRMTDLASCGLWLCSKTLETERPHSACNGSALSLSDLLPACLEWLTYANFKLAKLCADEHTPVFLQANGEVLSSLGPLASGKNIPNHKFSLARWLFWRQRFGQLYLHGDASIRQTARKCFELMVATGRLVGIDIPGEKQYLQHIFRALEVELESRGGKGCVEPEDIEIDSRWADEAPAV